MLTPHVCVVCSAVFSPCGSTDWCWRFGYTSSEYGVGIGEERADTWWSSKRVADLSPKTPITIEPTVTCREAVEILHSHGFDNLPVVSDKGTIVGVVTEGNLTAKMASGRVAADDTVEGAMYKVFSKVTLETPLGDLARYFDTDHFALVATSQTSISSGGAATERSVIFGIVSRIDLLKYIAENEPRDRAASGSGAGAGAGSD